MQEGGNPDCSPTLNCRAVFRDARKVHGVTVQASVQLDSVADELDRATILAVCRIGQGRP